MSDLSKPNTGRQQRPSPTRSNAIRELNDALRKSFSGGVVTLTAGIDALPVDTKEQLLAAVRAFKDFDEGNDPHGEHDFGAIEIEGIRAFFKVDYYDRKLTMHTDDPTDPEQTTRVMTIMLAEEY